jgi:hypothetical protein
LDTIGELLLGKETTDLVGKYNQKTTKPSQSNIIDWLSKMVADYKTKSNSKTEKELQRKL